MKRLLVLLVSGCLTVAAFGQMPAAAIRPAPTPATPPPAQPALLGPGAVAPDFVMHDIAGKEVRLSDFAGKVVILDFWAPWCGPCIASFPHTQELAARYKEEGVIVLASGTSDAIANFKKWIPENQAKYPDMIFAYDLNERGGPTFDQRASAKFYGVTGIPTQFVIGRDGKVAAAIVGNGGASDARVEATLANLGIKVPADVAARGREQLVESARRDAARAVAAAENERNPPPPFREDFGRLKAGETVPDFEVQDAAGATRSFSELAAGKTVVLGIWSAGNGPPEAMQAIWNTWQTTYRDADVQFLGLGAFGDRESFDTWLARQTELAFPVVFDPAGRLPAPAKPMDELSEDERAAYMASQRAHMNSTIPSRLGGIMPMIPAFIVIDSGGKLVGWSSGFGAPHTTALGNLLMRAGVKLTAADTPARVYTVAETRPAAPASDATRPAPLKIGALAPDFTTRDLDGKEVKLSDYRGKVVVLDFWATWCGPCLTAMPHTQKVAAQYKDQGVVVLGSATSDSRARFESWVLDNREKYPDILWSHDPAERTPERASYALYGVTGIPTQFIIDREGRVVDIVVGYLPGEVILDASLAKAGVTVDPAIREKAVADLARRAASAADPGPTTAPLPLVRPRT